MSVSSDVALLAVQLVSEVFGIGGLEDLQRADPSARNGVVPRPIGFGIDIVIDAGHLDRVGVEFIAGNGLQDILAVVEQVEDRADMILREEIIAGRQCRIAP
jgi:hypothetical protein